MKNFSYKILKDTKIKKIKKILFNINKFIFGPATGSPTATVLRLRPSPQSCCRDCLKLIKTHKEIFVILKLIRQPLLTIPIPMAWRAVCTKIENIFTATFFFAITSDSAFMFSTYREQFELRLIFNDLLKLAFLLHFVIIIVVRV